MKRGTGYENTLRYPLLVLLSSYFYVDLYPPRNYLCTWCEVRLDFIFSKWLVICDPEAILSDGVSAPIVDFRRWEISLYSASKRGHLST